jgi:hypothetical protein
MAAPWRAAGPAGSPVVLPLSERDGTLGSPRKTRTFSNCQVAEHCWNPVRLAIVDYAGRFERLKGAVQGGR